MKINNITIQQFGKLREREFELSEGLNIIYGPNGSGKSTLHAFIRAMIFGISRYRGRAAKTDPYSRYEPWGQPFSYAGSMKFQVGEKEFWLERNFYAAAGGRTSHYGANSKYGERESLICLNDGEELSIAHGDLEMILGGISERVYDNTVSVGQLRSETDQGMVQELQNYIANYEGSGSANVDAAKAMEVLRKKKRDWEKRLNLCRQDQQEHFRQQEQQIEYIQREVREYRDQLLLNQQAKAELSSKETQITQEIDKLKEEYDRESEEPRKIGETKQKKIDFSGIVSLLLLVVGGLFLSYVVWGWIQNLVNMKSPLFWVCCVGAFLCFLLGIRGCYWYLHGYNPGEAIEWRDSETENKWLLHLQKKGEQLHQLDERRISMQAEMSRLSGREEMLLGEIEEKTTVLQNLQENLQEIQKESVQSKECLLEIEALDLAMETLQGLSGKMKMRIGRQLKYGMETALAELTAGRYNRIDLDEDMKITLYEGNQPVPLFQLSRGTVEQVYLALRMAVSEVLCEEPMPILLDEVFAMYDDERLEQTLLWLARRGGQILIFSCHKREEEMAKRLGIRSNVIHMEE